MTQVYVPGGEFMMGSTDEEVNDALQQCAEAYGDCRRSWFEDEQPAHRVLLDGFWIDRTEVTNVQFAARSPTRNPQGPEKGRFRVQRGGSWTTSLRDARSARRHRYPASWQDHAVGFRCAMSAFQKDI
jgi:formylglycine-generating enzyme required for sulfatase activity